MKQNKQMSPDIKVALHNGVKFDSAGLGGKKKKKTVCFLKSVHLLTWENRCVTLWRISFIRYQDGALLATHLLASYQEYFYFKQQEK